MAYYTDDTCINVNTLSIVLCSALYIETRAIMEVDGVMVVYYTDDTCINVNTLSIVLCSALYIETRAIMEFMLQMCVCAKLIKVAPSPCVWRLGFKTAI